MNYRLVMLLLAVCSLPIVTDILISEETSQPKNETIAPQEKFVFKELSREDELEFLIDKLKSPDPLVVLEVKEDILELGPWVVPQLIKHLDDSDITIKYIACELLAEFRNSLAVEPLTKKLDDKDKKPFAVYQAAIRALGVLGDKSVCKKLIDILGATDDPDTQYEIIKALGNLRSKDAAPSITKLLEKFKEEKENTPTSVQRYPLCAAIQALGEIRSADVIPALIGLLDSAKVEPGTSCSIAYYAIRALERITLKSSSHQLGLGGIEEVKEAVAEWKKWWEDNNPKKETHQPPKETTPQPSSGENKEK